MSRRDWIAELLRGAGEAHHRAFADVGGEDPGWPAWYAAYLEEPLRVELGVRLERGLLVRALEAAEAERQAQDPGAEWSRCYAERLVRRYGGSA